MFVEAQPQLCGHDVACALALRRAQLKQRAVVLAQQPAELVAGLRALDRGEQHPAVLRGVARSGPVAFLFSGQGSQWPGMGRELYEHFSVFGAALDEVCGELDGFIGRSVRDVMFAAEGSPEAQLLGDTQYTQVALFALQVALYRLVESFGIRADYLVGHSIGEYAAAHVAGVFSLRDGCRLVSERARLMGALPAGGAMLAVQADGQEAEASLEGCEDRVALAAVNAPRAVVLSGDAAAIEQLETLWRERGRKTTRLRVSHAFHSQAMDAMLDDLTAVARQIACSPPRIPIVSNLTGEPLTAQQACSPEYWAQHVRQTVRFADGITWLQRAGVTRMLELGPDATLSALAAQTVDDDDVLAVSTLRGAKHPQAETFMTFLAAAHCHGVPIEWRSTFDANAVGRVELPTYAFEREHYWLAGGAGAGDVSAAGLGVVEHPLIGASMHLAGSDEWRFTGSWSLAAHPWLADHAVFDTVIAPGTAFAELALRAGAQLGCDAIDELTLHAPLLLPEHGAVALQVAIGAPDEGGRRSIEIYSQSAAPAEDGDPEAWTLHAGGVLATADAGEPATDQLAGESWPPAGAQPFAVGDLYDRLAASGYAYGPALQGVSAAWRRGEEIFSEVSLDDRELDEAARYGVHPALLDAALHTTLGLLHDELEPGKAPLPFSWSGVRILRPGTTTLRVRAVRSDQVLHLSALDDSGRPALVVEALTSRTIDASRLRVGSTPAAADSLFVVDWAEVALASPDGDAGRVVVLGDDHDLGARLSNLAASDGDPSGANGGAPDALVAFVPVVDGDPAAAAHAVTGATLALVQAFLAHARLAGTRLVIVTRAAVALQGESPDLAQAAVWGLVRSAQSEHPDRFVLVDVDVDDDFDAGWPAVVATGEPQLAIRGATAYAPRLARARGLTPPSGSGDGWRLGIEQKGTLENLALVASDAGHRPLNEGEVRIAVRAAGVNFRDVLIALGIYPGEAPLGSEAAGVVVEIGAGAEGLEVGDRVMGAIGDGFGPLAVAERHAVVRFPDEWSFAEAASVPAVFLTAYFALVDLANLKAGETLLVHAAAGGVGMAAVQIARHLGADVYATASPAKWDAVRALGIPDDHIASSRDLAFRERFLVATGGAGVDVVLDALAREFVDASLDLLPRGGRFVEMGKADVRDAGEVAQAHPGVRYRAFDLVEAGPRRIEEMLREVVALFERGVLHHAPITTWDVRRGATAFRHLREARHIGKVVLTIPRAPDPDGTVLVTGGVSGLGALVARHLAARHDVRRLLLVSRRGRDAEGAEALVGELAALGCEATVAACDVADRDALARLLGSLEHPLTAVVHAAGVLDDGVVAALDPEQLERVMRPKVDAAMNLHELTRGSELSDFVLFSSAAAVLGSPGQGNYAAANAFLDALAQQRHGQGLVARSLAWGLWAQAGGMSASLDEQEVARIARTGIQPLATERGLELLDLARQLDEPLLVPIGLDRVALGVAAAAGMLPPLLRGIASAPQRRARDAGASLARRLGAVDETQRAQLVLEVVRGHVAAVLGHASADAVEPDRSFKELGLDSLAAVELRNRLVQETGMRLPTTLVFDHPTSVAIAEHLRAQQPDQEPATTTAPAGTGAAAAGTLGALLRHAHAHGAIVEAVSVLTEASRFAPGFGSADELDDASGYAVRLAAGDGGPALVCIPSFVVGSGPHQFVRFASHFDGERDVFACALPGCRGSEPAPASWRAAVDVLAESIRAAVGDEPCVLVGYSIGGVLAHAVAELLESDGAAPVGLVLVDTPATNAGEDMRHILSSVMTVLLDREQDTGAVDDAGWMAMLTYLRLLREWQPGRAVAPSLLLRAGVREPGAIWPSWDAADEVAELASDHFALIEADAGATAAAVGHWLEVHVKRAIGAS